ncbi:MAG: hypothetical protein AB8C13_03670 [Phycisphaerales bacterium]
MNKNAQIYSMRSLAVLGPILSLLGFQLFTSEPANASADYGSTEFYTLPEVPDVLVDTVHTTALNEVAESPFWFESKEIAMPFLPQVPVTEEVQLAEDPVFTLTSVLPSGNRSLAIVNGKPHQEGAEIYPGWVLQTIAGKQRFIVVEELSTGRRLRIRMK